MNAEPLLTPAPDCAWIFVPELQGRRTNLSVGISLQDGRMTALAQWSPPSDPTTGRFCLATDREQVARLLTIARAAVGSGTA